MEDVSCRMEFYFHTQIKILLFTCIFLPIGYQFSCLIMTTVSISTARHGFKFCLVYSSLIFSQQSTWDTRMPVFDSWWTCGSFRLIKNKLEYHLLYSNETAERRGSRAKGKEIEHWLNVQPFLEQEEKIST